MQAELQTEKCVSKKELGCKRRKLPVIIFDLPLLQQGCYFFFLHIYGVRFKTQTGMIFSA